MILPSYVFVHNALEISLLAKYLLEKDESNLLTAMIKSLWSLNVIRGSDRHLVKRTKAQFFFFLKIK